MNESKIYRALGLMSGTSLDGIDAAIIDTDGTAILGYGPHITQPYEDDFREKLRSALGREDAPLDLVQDFTEQHAKAVSELLTKAGFEPADIDVIGFHGQTILHDPDRGTTVQIGDGNLLAAKTGVAVVNDFRRNDVGAGGQGAPFAPVYHQALAGRLEKPVVVLNVGGVANVTWIDEETMLAFDTGPGNSLMDDWVKMQAGIDFDLGGSMAAAGKVDVKILSTLMDNYYFLKKPPKSLDRNDFSILPVAGLSTEDGAATLAAFTIETVVSAKGFFPQPAKSWIVCGGGRKNNHLMLLLALKLGQDVRISEEAGWQGDALEAQAFAYMAVRSLMNLPISFPGTTGVPRPLSGGRLHTVQ